MKTPAECRCEAKECREIAALETDDDEKAYWLRRADEWERQAAKIQRREATDNAEKF